jgi:hypothetical protein
MMQMVLSIKANDKIDFRENPVTCFTCHRGQRQPDWSTTHAVDTIRS